MIMAVLWCIISMQEEEKEEQKQKVQQKVQEKQKVQRKEKVQQKEKGQQKVASEVAGKGRRKHQQFRQVVLEMAKGKRVRSPA